MWRCFRRQRKPSAQRCKRRSGLANLCHSFANCLANCCSLRCLILLPCPRAHFAVCLHGFCVVALQLHTRHQLQHDRQRPLSPDGGGVAQGPPRALWFGARLSLLHLGWAPSLAKRQQLAEMAQPVVRAMPRPSRCSARSCLLDCVCVTIGCSTQRRCHLLSLSGRLGRCRSSLSQPNLSPRRQTLAANDRLT